MTLLIFEVRLPDVPATATNEQMIAAFQAVAPKFIAFAVSFFTVAIYWVNHHHFFDRITSSNWQLLWANNLLLFFLTVVPFTTAVVGDHFGQPVAVALYGLDLGLAGAAFTLMGWYVFFRSDLLEPSITMAARRVEFRRSLAGAALYLLLVPLAFVITPVVLALYAVIPIGYVVPNLLGRDT